MRRPLVRLQLTRVLCGEKKKKPNQYEKRNGGRECASKSAERNIVCFDGIADNNVVCKPAFSRRWSASMVSQTTMSSANRRPTSDRFQPHIVTSTCKILGGSFVTGFFFFLPRVHWQRGKCRRTYHLSDRDFCQESNSKSPERKRCSPSTFDDVSAHRHGGDTFFSFILFCCFCLDIS